MSVNENSTELEQLKAEVAGLKQQLRELSQFICINGTVSGKKKLVIRCSSLRLFDPDDDYTQVSIAAGTAGPQINLNGPDDAPRIALKVDRKEGGSIQLFQPDWKLAIHLGHDKDGQPSVGVFDQGRPRAALKASEKCGIVTAVHDDGHVRATMVSQEDSGEIMLVNPDLKAAVKLSTQGQHGEGFITVNHANGKAAVIISALPEHGCVILNDTDGQMKYTVPDPKSI